MLVYDWCPNVGDVKFSPVGSQEQNEWKTLEASTSLILAQHQCQDHYVVS